MPPLQRLDWPTQPEVPQLERREVRGAEEVGGLDVAVHERGLAVVEEVERGAELHAPAGDRGTSLVRNCKLLGPYSRTVPRALRWFKGGGSLLMSEATGVRQPRQIRVCILRLCCSAQDASVCILCMCVRVCDSVSVCVSVVCACDYVRRVDRMYGRERAPGKRRLFGRTPRAPVLALLVHRILQTPAI